MSSPIILGLMTFCFLFFGYLGVPVPFSLLAGVLIALFTIEQLVNGITKGFDHPEPPEEELAIPPVDTGVQRRARP